MAFAFSASFFAWPLRSEGGGLSRGDACSCWSWGCAPESDEFPRASADACIAIDASAASALASVALAVFMPRGLVFFALAHHT